MSKNVSKILFILAAALLVIITGCKKDEVAATTTTTVKEAETQRKFIVAGVPEEPNRWADENGVQKGIDIDIIKYILEKMGISYEIILEASSPRLEANWQNDKPSYDMVFTYSIKPERQEYLDYAKESHIAFSWNFFIKKEDEGKFKFEEFEDLKGVKIGATKGFSYIDEFWEAGEEGVLDLDIIQKNELQMNKLLHGRIDMVPLNTQATLYEAKKGGFLDKISYLKKPIKSKPYYNTFVKKSDYPGMEDIKKQYDEILKQMKEDGTLASILSEYGL